ncbi:MAG: hypothetical protein OWU32_05225 [Firmicutes bacterium]|nr:hypothetical protein [Bacillota bacterium]
MRYGLLTEQSRKARAARTLYEYIRVRSRAQPVAGGQVALWPVQDGFQVAAVDRFRVLELRLHEEHMSPYFKTDLNLFHLLMLDDSIDMALYKTAEGVLFVFEGLPECPQPFGVHGHDMR